jgi:hypothetical protein
MIFYQKFALSALAWGMLNTNCDSTFNELLEHVFKIANTNTKIHVIILMLCSNFG